MVSGNQGPWREQMHSGVPHSAGSFVQYEQQASPTIPVISTHPGTHQNSFPDQGQEGGGYTRVAQEHVNEAAALALVMQELGGRGTSTHTPFPTI